MNVKINDSLIIVTKLTISWNEFSSGKKCLWFSSPLLCMLIMLLGLIFFSNMNYGLISELEQTYDIRLTNDICVCIIINTPGRTNTLSQRILHRHFKHFLHTLKSLKFFVV